MMRPLPPRRSRSADRLERRILYSPKRAISRRGVIALFAGSLRRRRRCYGCSSVFEILGCDPGSKLIVTM